MDCFEVEIEKVAAPSRAEGGDLEVTERFKLHYPR